MTMDQKKKKTTPQLRLFSTPIPVDDVEPMKQPKKVADRAWTTKAYLVIAACARAEIPFTTDLVWARLGKDRPAEPRALGPVMIAAEKEGIIERMSGASPSVMSACHGRHKRRWRGKVAA